MSDEALPVEMVVPVSDVKRVRDVLTAMATYFEAEEVMRSQKMLTPEVRSYPLLTEIQKIHVRFSSLLADHVLAQEDARETGEDGQHEPVDDLPEFEEPVGHVPMLSGPDLTRVAKQARPTEVQDVPTVESVPEVGSIDE